MCNTCEACSAPANDRLCSRCEAELNAWLREHEDADREAFIQFAESLDL